MRRPVVLLRGARRARARLGNGATTTLRSLRDLRDVPPAAQGAAGARGDSRPSTGARTSPSPKATGVARPRARSARGRGRMIQESRARTPFPEAPRRAFQHAPTRGAHARDSEMGRPQPFGHFVAEGLCHPPPTGRRELAGIPVRRRARGLPRRRRRRGWHVPEREARGVVVARSKSLAREPLSRSTKASVPARDDAGRARARLGNGATTTLRPLRGRRDVPPAGLCPAEGREIRARHV
jgi:hypothetical protein